MNDLIARPDIQSRLARIPIAKWFARRDGAALFGIIQGFVSSQVVVALVELGVFDRLAAGPASVNALAHALEADPERLQVFLQAGAALRVLKRRRDGSFALSRRGAALRGVPGLADMILHHRVFFRDLEDPKRLVQGRPATELSQFWPYVLSPDKIGEQEAARYSHLMTQSQQMVAEDTLRQVSFSGVKHLMDVGGGSGAFLSAVAQKHPGLELTLFDLPQTQAAAQKHLAATGLTKRVALRCGSFKSDALPKGRDAISLIRVLYDHTDDTVRGLLAAVYDALPAGGRVVVSEPMSGGAAPDSITDVYFALYTMAMGTGRTRSAEEIRALLIEAGFEQVRTPRPLRSYITRAVTAVKPARARGALPK